jgi:hypothetical protein
MVSLPQRQRLRGVSFSLFKIDRIHSFDIRHSTFDIRLFGVSYSIKLADSAARGHTET